MSEGEISKSKRLLEAVVNGDVNLVDELVSETGANVNHLYGGEKLSPKICLAANLGRVEVCGVDGYTLLHCAVIGGHLECAKILLKSAADPNIKCEKYRMKLPGLVETHEGVTALHLAVLLGDVEMVKMVVEIGEVDTKDESDRTALHLTCGRPCVDGYRQAEILKILLDEGADPNISCKHVKRLPDDEKPRKSSAIFPLEILLQSTNHAAAVKVMLENKRLKMHTLHFDSVLHAVCLGDAARDEAVVAEILDCFLGDEKTCARVLPQFLKRCPYLFNDENIQEDAKDEERNSSKRILRYMQQDKFYDKCLRQVDTVYSSLQDIQESYHINFAEYLGGIIRDSDVTEFEKLLQKGHLRQLYTITRNDFKKVFNICLENKLPITLLAVARSYRRKFSDSIKNHVCCGNAAAKRGLIDCCFETFDKKFPMLCVVFGRYNLVEKYFELTAWHDNLPHGAFIIHQLRKVLSVSVLGELQKQTIHRTISSIDARMTYIMELVMSEKHINVEVTKLFLVDKFAQLERKSIMDLSVDSECVHFLQSDFSILTVDKSWRGYGRGDIAEMDIILTRWATRFIYFPLVLLAMLLSLLLILPAFVERLVMCCCGRKSGKVEPTSQTSSVFDAMQLEEKKVYLKTLKAVRFLKKYVKRIRHKAFRPFIRFVLDGLSHFGFICSLSYLVARNIHYHVTWNELLICIYSGCLFVEEVRQINHFIRNTGVIDYFEFWNIMDCFGLTFLLAGLIVKNIAIVFKSDFYQRCAKVSGQPITSSLLSEQEKQCLLEETNDLVLYFARFLIVVSLLCYFVKFMRIASIFQKLGPTLKMMADMVMINLIPFLFIIAVFMFAFGIAFTALTFPNAITKENFINNFTAADFDEFSFSKGLVFAFYGLVGSYNIFDLTFNLHNPDHDEISNHGQPHPWAQYTIVYILLPLYVIIVNILLLNLLIAMFGNTVNHIEEKSKVYWHILRYKLAKDYSIRSVLPPPFNIVDVLFDFILIICNLLQYVKRENFWIERAGKKKVRSLIFSYIQASCLKKEKEKEKKEELLVEQGSDDLVKKLLTSFETIITRQTVLEESVKIVLERLEKQ